MAKTWKVFFVCYLLAQLVLYCITLIASAFVQSFFFFFLIAPLAFRITYWVLLYKRSNYRVIANLLFDLSIVVVPLIGLGEIAKTRASELLLPSPLTLMASIIVVIAYWVMVMQRRERRYTSLFVKVSAA